MHTADALLLHLTAFQPTRPTASADDWHALAELAPVHGVAPLIAYNVEYRLAGAGAPQVVRDLLLGHYQGALADNVFKLVNLKKALAECPDLPVLILDAAAFADSLYPHIAFRPMSELRVLVRPGDLQAVQRGFAEAGYPPVDDADPLGAQAISTDGRTRIAIHTQLLTQLVGDARAAETQGVWDRALPSKAFGPRALRPSLEDALLCAVLLQARQGFDTPLVEAIDLREAARGAPELGGPYSRPPDPAALLSRARAFKLERGLWAAMARVAALFPGEAEAARALQPALRGSSQALLQKLVVDPSRDLRRTHAARGLPRLRRLLSGG